MPTVKVRNLKNEEVGDVELSDAVFGVELNEALIHAAVKNYHGERAGRARSATKTRGDVSGSGRKLWKQKGTGRARIASHPLAAVEGRRQRSRAAAARLVVQPCRRRCGAARCARRCRSGCARATWSSSTSSVFGAAEDEGFRRRAGDARARRARRSIVDSLDNENLVLCRRAMCKRREGRRRAAV